MLRQRRTARLGCRGHPVLPRTTGRGGRRHRVAGHVPVNLRDPRKWKELGNKFGLVPLLLPVGIANPIARVYEVRRRMDQLKQSYTAVLTMGILGAAGLVPRALQSRRSTSWRKRPLRS